MYIKCIVKCIVKNKKAFSLLEVMVAMLIISIGMIGVISLIVSNINLSNLSKNKLIAMNLAQEGIELVRNIRDENWLDGDDWQDGIINDGSYIVDYSGESSVNDVPDDIDDNSAKLYLDGDGFYQHSVTADDTVFSRLIIITDDTATSTTVRSYVKWRQGDKIFDYIVDSIIYDWKI